MVELPQAVEVTVGGNHTISSQVIFSSDTVITVQGPTDSLTLSQSPVVQPGVALTKAGAGELAVLDDLDLGGEGLGILMDEAMFTSPSPQIAVVGSVTVAGTLDLDLVGGFEPGIGEAFTILEYSGALTGIFDTVNFPSVDDVSFGVIYNPGSLSLQTVLEGDLNNDGFVGLGDLSIVLVNSNDSVDAGVLLQGDPSGDGFVGIDDQNIVLGNWNARTPPSAAVTLVPEPMAAAVFMITGMITLQNRRRQF